MHRSFVESEVDERSIVGLYDEEEDLFNGDTKDGGSKDCVRWVGPDVLPNQVRVPWCGGYDSDLIN